MLNYLSRTKLRGLWFAFLIYIYRREGVNHVLGPAGQEAAGAEPRKQNLVVRAREAGSGRRPPSRRPGASSGCARPAPRRRRPSEARSRLARGPTARASP